MLALLLSLLLVAQAAAQQTPAPAPVVSEAQRLIRQQRYNDAINRLEIHLEGAPQDGEAMAFLGAAHLYAERETTRAREVFEASFAAGGGASFWVNHSHQTMLDGDDLTDYCRGWLHLRPGFVQYVPEDGDHGFRVPYAEVAEFKQNRNKAFFHIKRGGKNQNFRPRSADQRETLLLLILFNKFSR